MKDKAASLLSVRSLVSSRSAWFSVRVPPVLVKLVPTASVVFCRLIAAPLIFMPLAKLNLPPVEVIVVPLVISTGSAEMTVRSASFVANVQGGDVFDPLLLSELPISSVKSVVADPRVKVLLSNLRPPSVKPAFLVTVASSPS